MVPDPPEELPAGLRPLYVEAAAVSDASPASACALLRLLTRAVLRNHGLTGRDLQRDISALVEQGASMSLLRALDAMGLTEQHSRHPGEIDLAQGHSDAQSLFMFVNLLAANTAPSR
jgi:hypothetical protein